MKGHFHRIQSVESQLGPQTTPHEIRFRQDSDRTRQDLVSVLPHCQEPTGPTGLFYLMRVRARKYGNKTFFCRVISVSNPIGPIGVNNGAPKWSLCPIGVLSEVLSETSRTFHA